MLTRYFSHSELVKTGGTFGSDVITSSIIEKKSVKCRRYRQTRHAQWHMDMLPKLLHFASPQRTSKVVTDRSWLARCLMQV